MELKSKASIDKICKHSEHMDKSYVCRDEFIYCNHPKRNKDMDYICIATKFFETGHSTPNAVIDIKKMYKCEYRNE